MRFVTILKDEDGAISSREFEGYSYQGQAVDVWAERFSMVGERDKYIVTIRAKDGNFTELATSKTCANLHTAFRWARNKLDGYPSVYGELDLRDSKSDAAVKGEGAELYIAGYIMLELGYIVSVASPNMPGYDLLVVDPKTKKSCTVQVKYRSSNTSSLKLNSTDFDFLVLVDKPTHEIQKVSVNVSRPIATFDVWILDNKCVKEQVRANGLLSNPRYDIFYHNWSVLVQHLSEIK
ncbi:hypothetical protein VDT1_3194 [Vibrio sp. 16]|nr:hypothetical protein VDT1_3194 [Vibrio sp. 16]